MEKIKTYTLNGVEYQDWDDIEIIPEESTYTRRYVDCKNETNRNERTVKIMNGITALLVDDKDGLKRGHLFVSDVCVDLVFAESFEEVLEDFRDLVTALGTKELFTVAEIIEESNCGIDYAVGRGNPDNFDYIWDGFQYRKESIHKIRFVD